MLALMGIGFLATAEPREPPPAIDATVLESMLAAVRMAAPGCGCCCVGPLRR